MVNIVSERMCVYVCIYASLYLFKTYGVKI